MENNLFEKLSKLKNEVLPKKIVEETSKFQFKKDVILKIDGKLMELD